MSNHVRALNEMGEHVRELEARVVELEALIRTMVTREKYNEALFAAAEATGARDRLFGLLHHIDEEIQELDSGTPGA